MCRSQQFSALFSPLVVCLLSLGSYGCGFSSEPEETELTVLQDLRDLMDADASARAEAEQKLLFVAMAGMLGVGFAWGAMTWRLVCIAKNERSPL